MRILISGASGLIGSALVARSTALGHVPVALARGEHVPPAAVRWDPADDAFDATAAEGADAVIHLAGENIAGGRWTRERMRRIRDSRVVGTRLLAEGIARLERKPRVWVGASAIGAYGDRGDEILDEDSAPGQGFLADVCREWEAASEPVEAAGVRRVLLRTGAVLTPKGGALAKMLTPFKLGIAGVIGSGEQWMSWITLDDLCGIFERALQAEDMRGVFNAVAPEPVQNHEFTKTLGKVLHRPTVLPLPAIAARLAFGKLADALLLASTRVVPRRLLDAGHSFAHPTLEPALRALL